MGPTMARITLLPVLILWAAARRGRGDEITEKGLSLLGYHLCNYTLTKNVFKMVTYQKSYEKNTSCGGWIPWMVCPRTHSRTQYHRVEVPETTTLTDCCEGYEQVGLYCSLALNRSSVFASRPGVCPVKDKETSDYPCTFDSECPGLKKCCSSSKGAGCMDPVPEGRMFWYNVTVLVKMDFNELIRVDSHLLNHSRLLHSVITGALQPLNVSVHHIQSNHGEIYAGTVASQVLLGMHHPAPRAEVSSSLQAMVKRVYEVIDTQVRDVDECSYAELNACPERSSCVNLEGCYSCDPQHEHATVIPHQLSPRKAGISASTPSSALNAVNTGSSSPSMRNSSLLSITNQFTDAGCYPSAVTNHRILSVTSHSFEMSWLVTSTLNHTVQVRLLKGNEIVQNLQTEEMQIDVSGLEAGVMYSVEISYETCGKTIISHQNVKTEAKIFDATMRILNYNFTEDFHNSSSSAYEEFSRLLITEAELELVSFKYSLGTKATPKVVNDTFPEPSPGTNQPASQQLGLPKYCGHIPVACWDWPQGEDKFKLCLGDSWVVVVKIKPETGPATVEMTKFQSLGVQRLNNPSSPSLSSQQSCSIPLLILVPPLDSLQQLHVLPVLGPRAGAALQLENSFPPNISALYKSGKLKVQIESLAAGSIVVRLRIAVQDPEFPVDASIFAPVLSYLHNGSVLVVDQQNTAVEDWDECASQAENDCSVFAECINVMGSYTCRCKTTVDTNPSRPGRNCEGEIVDPPAETMAPEIRNSTEFAPGEGSPAGPAPLGTTEGMAAAGSMSGAATLLPAALPLRDKQGSHSPTSAPSAPWRKDLAPQTGFSRDKTPTATGVAPGGAVGTEHREATSPSRRSSALPNTPMGTASKEPLGSVRLFPNQTASATSRSHRAAAVPRAGSRGGPGTAAPATGNAGIATLDATLGARVPVGRQNSSCSEEFTGAPGSPALPGTSAAPGQDRTVRKLSSTVRITNMKCSPGSSNTSSEEYQTLAQLFVDEVHKSLPLEVLQQVDAGLMKVLITGVSNGSRVLIFHLLLAGDVDIQQVITTFRDALEHSSCFTIDRSSLSIHAFPISQKATVMDEKPVHNTVLPVTSLQTSTHVSSPASLDFSPAGHKALEDTMFSSTVLPPLTTDPVAAPEVSPRASPVPFVKPPQEVSIKDAVSVFCETERIVLAIQKSFLQQESIPESSLFLGEPGCSVSTSNGTHVVLQAGWSDCGTRVETNMTTTIVKTTLRNDVSARGIIHHLNIASPIHCVFQNDVLTSSGYTAGGLYTIFEDLHGSGHFRTEMQLFIENSPIPKNFSVSASEDVLIEVGMQRADSKLKVVLTDCWATPTNHAVDPLSFVFISNSCPIPNTYTTLLENGNSSKAQFKTKIFSFVNNSVVYLHCRIRICMETPGSTCRTRCRAMARLLKAGGTIALRRTSWGPLWQSAASDMKREKEAGLGIGYTILIALAVFGFVLGAVALLIFLYQRKTGRYNFRIKSDNFSYQVFYD